MQTNGWHKLVLSPWESLSIQHGDSPGTAWARGQPSQVPPWETPYKPPAQLLMVPHLRCSPTYRPWRLLNLHLLLLTLLADAQDQVDCSSQPAGAPWRQQQRRGLRGIPGQSLLRGSQVARLPPALLPSQWCVQERRCWKGAHCSHRHLRLWTWHRCGEGAERDPVWAKDALPSTRGTLLLRIKRKETVEEGSLYFKTILPLSCLKHRVSQGKTPSSSTSVPQASSRALSAADRSPGWQGMLARGSLDPSCPPACSQGPAGASALASAPAPSPACSAAPPGAPGSVRMERRCWGARRDPVPLTGLRAHSLLSPPGLLQRDFRRMLRGCSPLTIALKLCSSATSCCPAAASFSNSFSFASIFLSSSSHWGSRRPWLLGLSEKI